MPRYDVMCEDGHRHTVTASYAAFDSYMREFGGFPCEELIPPTGDRSVRSCEKPARVQLNREGASVAIFTGPGFTRRSTDPQGNRNIDHADWRGREDWPGPPEKKWKRPKVTNWTKDDFRKGAV